MSAENPRWLDEIIEAFKALGGEAHYQEVSGYIAKHTKRSLSSTWENTVRARIQEHSSDAQSYLRRGDYFQSAKGLGHGVWRLREISSATLIAPDVAEPVAPETKNVVVARVVRDTKVTRKLKQLYRNACQICGRSIYLPSQLYSEAHHMKPLGKPHRGPDVSGNIVIVCPDHHVELDYGAIGIEPRTLEVLHINKHDPLVGKPIHIQPEHGLDPRFLNYHMDIIFGNRPTIG
jgi:predicted restriction endonuclease